MQRRTLLSTVGTIGASATLFGGVASAEKNEKKPDKTVESERPIFIYNNGELGVHPSLKRSTDVDHKHIERKFNEWLDAGIIKTRQPSAKASSARAEVSDRSVIVTPVRTRPEEILPHKQSTNSLTSNESISLLSHGQNSFSGDISTWGTPWRTHEVKLDSDNTYTLENLLILGAGAHSMASFLAGVYGGPIGMALGALSIALATKLALTENQIEEVRAGHGIQFLFRYSDGCIDFGGYIEYCVTDNYAEQFGWAYITFILTNLASQ